MFVSAKMECGRPPGTEIQSLPSLHIFVIMLSNKHIAAPPLPLLLPVPREHNIIAAAVAAPPLPPPACHREHHEHTNLHVSLE